MFTHMEETVYDLYSLDDVYAVMWRTNLSYEDSIELLYNFGVQHTGCFFPDADEAVDMWEDCEFG